MRIWLTWLTLLTGLTAANLKLAWNANPEANIAGYVLHYGSGQMDRRQATGNVTSTTLGGLVEGVAYTISIQAVDDAGNLSDLSAPITATVVSTPKLPRDGWVVTASSEETIKEDNRAANAIDGDPQSLWHTTWGLTLPPHYLRIELPRAAMVSGLSYLPRQDGGVNGIVTSYEIETSMDGELWTAAGTGDWPADAAEKYAALPLGEVRFVRVWGSDARMAAAEMWLHGVYVPQAGSVRVTLQASTDLKTWQDLWETTRPIGTREFYRVGTEVRP